MKKTKSNPKRVVAASKAKAAPAKKPGKPAPVKPATKAKVPEKKTVVTKSTPVVKKSAAPVAAKKPESKADAKKEEAKKPVAAPTKVVAKDKVQEKISVGTKKADVGSKAGAAAKPAAAPTSALKVEPKIIETAQPEFRKPIVDGDMFTQDELDNFRVLLESEKKKILDKARRAMEDGGITIDKNDLMDEVDQASAMVEQNLTFRLLDRDRKLLTEIEHAILKLDSGEFGYCEGTGEPIPKRRLELRPWCRHSVKYKEKLERMKKSGRGVVDEDEV